MVPMTNAKPGQASLLEDQALPAGTVLCGDQFTITGLLGAGGFGITYRATDNILARDVVVKECFPSDFCFREGRDAVARSRAYGESIYSIVKMFMREARSLAKLRHPNIVGVHRIFEENGTAYMVIDLIEGRDLADILDARTHVLSPARVRDILLQLLDAIEKVHELDLLHRDISPDNILIEPAGRPVLIDFGAARGDASHHTRAVSSLMVVKDGYSPQEFYVAGSLQTPASDLYALAATFYHVLTGVAPPNSQTRMMEIAGKKPDPCVPLAGRIPGYDAAFLEAIDTAMRIHPGDRLQSAAKWRSMIAGGPTAVVPEPERPSAKDLSLDLELSLTQLVAETNDEVRRISQSPVLPPEEKAKPARKKAAKPAWVEEFNRDTLAAEEEARARARAEAKARADAEIQAAMAALEARAASDDTAEEGGADAPPPDRTVPAPTSLPSETGADIAPATPSRRRGQPSLALLVGLLLCAFAVVLVQTS